jgi:hypothetical protein
MDDPRNVSWGDGSPIEFWADSPDLLCFDPMALDFLAEQLGSMPPLSQDALRDRLIELCQNASDMAYYQIEDFSPGLFRLDLHDICKFGSEEEDMSDEEWERSQSDQDEVPPQYFAVDSAAILIADISHLKQLTQVLTPEQYDLAMAEDTVLPEINEALGGPYYALAMPCSELEFDGDGTYMIRKGAIQCVKE